MTSHIMFDSSYVSDTWDWFESILIVIDRELWYDLTLGHSHLREFFFYWMTIMSRHTFLSRWRIFEPCPFLGGYQMSFSTLEHETWLTHFMWCTLHRGIPLSIDDSFLGIVVPRRRLDSFHIGVRDMIGWFLWCDHRSIAFSSLWTYFFWDDWVGTQTLMRACSGV